MRLTCRGRLDLFSLSRPRPPVHPHACLFRVHRDLPACKALTPRACMPPEQVTDRLKNLDTRIEMKANMAGELQLGTAVVCLCVYWRVGVSACVCKCVGVCAGVLLTSMDVCHCLLVCDGLCLHLLPRRRVTGRDMSLFPASPMRAIFETDGIWVHGLFHYYCILSCIIILSLLYHFILMNK